MKLYNKKGISPLIATVLVIGFTIVLAGVVMQFIMPLFVQSGEKAKADAALMRTCSDLSTNLAIKSAVNGGVGVGFNLVIDNPTATNIQYLIVKLYSKTGAATSCKYIAGPDNTENPAIPAGGIASMIFSSGEGEPVYVADSTVGLIGMDGTTPCTGLKAIDPNGDYTTLSKVEITPAVFLKETKETKPCGSVTVSATVY